MTRHVGDAGIVPAARAPIVAASFDPEVGL